MDDPYAGTPEHLFDACKEGEIDAHWYLDPLCQSGEFVKDRWEEPRLVCNKPRDYFEHNEIENPDEMERKHEFKAPTDPLVWGENAWRKNVCSGVSWQADAYMHGEPTARCSCPCHWGTYYVNIYQLSRNYGGAEEGGWWYDSGSPVGAIPCESFAEAEEIREKYEQRYPSTKSRYSMRPSEEDFSIHIEQTMAAPWPERTPRYE